MVCYNDHANITLKTCNRCEKEKCDLHEFTSKKNTCKNCLNVIKEPDIPATGCDWLLKSGDWCNNEVKYYHKCAIHCYKDPIGCEFKLKKSTQNVVRFCNKEKLDNCDFCENHNTAPELYCKDCNILLTIENKIFDRHQCKKCNSIQKKSIYNKNKETDSETDDSDELNNNESDKNNKCNVILTSGRNIGSICNIKIYKDGKCKIHYNKFINDKNKQEEKYKIKFCNIVLTTGNNIGSICNLEVHKDDKCIMHYNRSITQEINKCSFKIKEIFCDNESIHQTDFCEIHKKVCKHCNVLLINKTKIENGNYEKGNLACHSCKRKKNNEKIINNNIEYENNIGEGSSKKICSECNIEKHYTEYDSIYRNKCNSCRYELAKENSRITKEEYLLNNKNEIRCCLLCNEKKGILKFSWHINNFRNQCKTCINSFEYWKDYRNRKILEDPQAFKKHNNDIHKIWFEKNKERMIEYNKVFSNSKEGIISTYLSSAKAKNLLGMNENDFKNLINNLIIQNCFYCGRIPSEGNLQELIIGDYNGVDRINSDKSYNESNCIPCCKKCNLMKNTLDIASFLRKCTEISLYNNLNDNIDKNFDIRLKYYNDFNLVGDSCNYQTYKYESIRRNKEFELSKNEFDCIIIKPCYLCGKSNNKGIGIDRMNNEIGYILDNCKPCCSYCNYMKRDIDYIQFLEKIRCIVDISITEKHIELCNNSSLTRLLNNKILLNDNEENDIFDYIL